jgi:uncharacterized membrane protein YphA (DoxX/SURF4 family)
VVSEQVWFVRDPAVNTGLLILRVVLRLLVAAHGTQKLTHQGACLPLPGLRILQDP